MLFRSIQNKRWTTHIMYLPILDWTAVEVWDYIQYYHLPYSHLYDLGFCRIGCIGCPLKSLRLREKDFLIWPSYRKYYIDAFEKMLLNGKRNYTWKNADEVFDWWMKK